MRTLSVKMMFSLACFLFIFVLVGCSGENTEKVTYNNKTNQYLTAFVYNATIQNLENKQPIIEEDIEDISNNESFTYDKIKIFKGYSFKTILDFDLEPYFQQDYKGKEIDVYISFIGLHSKRYDAWYDQKMIIFKTDSEIVGFLTGSMGIINDLNPVNINLDDLQFESCHFLTKNEVVKYYEVGEKVYVFQVNMNDDDIILDIDSYNSPESENEILSNHVIPNSLIEIDSSEVYDIIDLTLIEKVEIEANVIGFDIETGLLNVESNDAPTLRTVNFNGSYIYDIDGELINYTDIKEGDVIQVYYYKRSETYQPVNIIVNEIRLIEHN